MIREPIAHRVERAKTKPLDPVVVVDDMFMTNAQIAELFVLDKMTVLRAQDAGELPYCAFGSPGSTQKTRRTPRRLVLEWAATRLVRRDQVKP